MWEKELSLAIQAAKSAGNYLKKNLTRSVDSSDGKDIKLEADRVSEKMIIELLEAQSQYPILSEEVGELGSINSDAIRWIVDPIDGTFNYKRGLDLACVSIALWKNDNSPILGVVYRFDTDELYSGIVGEGAKLNGNPITVSKVETLGQAALASGFPVNRDYGSDSLNKFVNLIQSFKKIRMFGTAAISTTFVACGRVDVYVEEDIMLWDVAAGVALVLAAGGVVKIEQSTKNKWGRHVYCAANESLIL